MNKLARFAATSAAVLTFAAVAGIGAPAHAATAKMVTIAQADYTPVLVTVSKSSSIYWGPDMADEIQTEDELHAGDTWYIIGQDSTGKWVQVFITNSFSPWVPMSTFTGLSSVPLPVVG